jgi:hypothetical protein
LRDRRKSEIGEAIWSRFSQSKKDTLWYYRSLADTFCERCPASCPMNLVTSLRCLRLAKVYPSALRFERFGLRNNQLRSLEKGTTKIPP